MKCEGNMDARAETADLALSPPQQDVVRGGLLFSGFSCVLQMPTGSGKTWLAERSIEDAIARGHRAIYLTPLRALAAELTARWQALFEPYKVGIFTGDYGANGKPYPVSFQDAQVLVIPRCDFGRPCLTLSQLRNEPEARRATLIQPSRTGNKLKVATARS